MSLFYTYVWKDAAGTPFYVGKGGKDGGARSRNASKRSLEFKEVYAKGGCTVEIVDEFVLESEAHAHEMELIERYGRRNYGGLLVNKTEGGEGNSGWVPSQETRAKIGYASSNRSPQTLAKMSATKKGKKASAETRAKLSAAHKGKIVSLETRAKLSVINKGKTLSDEHRAKLSIACVGRVNTPDSKVKVSASLLKRFEDPVERERLSAAARMSAPRSSNSSGFKGVSFHKASNKWRATIFEGGRHNHLNTFQTAQEAALAYDAAAIAAWGAGNCYLNFPPEAKAAA